MRDDGTVRPFEIAIAEEEIADLRARLSATRWPDALVSDWSDGADLAYVRDLCAYWADDFDWRAQEARINAFPQVLVNVDGRDVHALHVRGVGPAPMPLVLTHGWPGSVVEFLDIIPRLTDPARFGGDAADAFDVVVPSLPGYGFSQVPSEPGTNPAAIARTWVELMSALGYERFGAQGGDWGAAVSTLLGIEHAERTIGVHLNYVMRPFLPSRSALGDGATPEESAYLNSADGWTEAEGGYAHLQATKPQTLAFGLTDSPAGLAAYIVEKFRTWSDCHGDLERAISRDDVLADIALYWFTKTIGPSMHLYWNRRRSPLQPPATKPATPFAIAHFPAEIGGAPPRSLVERVFDVGRWTEMPRGGHFAALEQPELLAADVTAFFRTLR